MSTPSPGVWGRVTIPSLTCIPPITGSAESSIVADNQVACGIYGAQGSAASCRWSRGSRGDRRERQEDGGDGR